MLTTIFINEWRKAFRLGRIRWLSLMALVLILGSLIHAFTIYERYQDVRDEGSQLSRQDWLGQDAKNPHSAAHDGLYVFKPWSPGALFDTGVLPYTGQVVFVEAHKKNDAGYQEMTEKNALARIGEFTPAFVLIFLLPLVIILMHFDVVSGERESGMLRWHAASGVSFRRWLFGKWLAAWPVSVIFSVLCLGTTYAIAGFRSQDLPLCLTLLGAMLLYVGTMINVTFLFSKWLHRSGFALIGLLSFWILGAFAIPRTAVSTAEKVHALPNEASFRAAMGEAQQSGLPGDPGIEDRMAKLERETLASYGVTAPKDLPINYDALRMQSGEVYGNRVFDRYYDELRTLHEAQNNLLRLAGILSPLVPMRSLSMVLCRTDNVAHWHFNQAAERYRRVFVEILNNEMMTNSKTGDWAYKATPETWSKIPKFEYRFASSASVLSRGKIDFYLLLIWFGLTSCLLFLLPLRGQAWQVMP